MCCAVRGAPSHRITWHCSAMTSRDARHPGLEPCTRGSATHKLGPRRGQATHSRLCTCCRTPTSRRSCSTTADTPRSPPPSAHAPSAAWRATYCARPPPSPPTSTRSSLRAATAHPHRPTRSRTPPRPPPRPPRRRRARWWACTRARRTGCACLLSPIGAACRAARSSVAPIRPTAAPRSACSALRTARAVTALEARARRLQTSRPHHSF